MRLWGKSLSHREREGGPQGRKGEGETRLTLTLPTASPRAPSLSQREREFYQFSTTVTARRFSAQLWSSEPTFSGRSLP